MAWRVDCWICQCGTDPVVRWHPQRGLCLPRLLASSLDRGRCLGSVFGVSGVSPLRAGIAEADAERCDLRLRRSAVANVFRLHIAQSMEIDVSKKDARRA